MLKKTITYEDFNGEEVSEDFYFHLSKAELVELEMSQEGGLSAWLEGVVAAEDGKSIIAEFKKIILTSYGKRSPDGKRFTKNQQLREEFESTEAYSTLFMELVTDTDSAVQFVSGIIPSGMAEEAVKLTRADISAVPEPVAEKEMLVLTRKELQEMPQEELDKLAPRFAAGEVKLAE